jgi:hypothetical protein
MKFLKSVFKWDSDAGPVEKILTVVVPIGALILFAWLILASYGVGHSDLAVAHQTLKNPGSAAIFATILLFAAAFWAWWNWTDRIPFKVNEIVATIILLLLIILAINANTNFFSHVR